MVEVTSNAHKHHVHYHNKGSKGENFITMTKMMRLLYIHTHAHTYTGVYTCTAHTRAIARGIGGCCLRHVLCGETYNNHKLYWHRFKHPAKIFSLSACFDHEFPFCSAHYIVVTFIFSVSVCIEKLVLFFKSIFRAFVVFRTFCKHFVLVDFFSSLQKIPIYFLSTCFDGQFHNFG